MRPLHRKSAEMQVASSQSYSSSSQATIKKTCDYKTTEEKFSAQKKKLTLPRRLLPKCSKQNREGAVDGGRLRKETDVQHVRLGHDRVRDRAAKVFQSARKKRQFAGWRRTVHHSRGRLNRATPSKCAPWIRLSVVK